MLETAARRRMRRGREIVVAAGILAAAFACLAHPLIGGDPTRDVLAWKMPGYVPHEDGYPAGRVGLTDHRYVVWLVSHNARVLLSHPGHVFDSDACFPFVHGLATAEPVLTLGLLGAPAEWYWGEPIATFNSALLLLTVIAAAAMYALVRHWTGSAAASLVAALLYSFHALRVTDVSHMYIYDTGWTVLALLFASRLFERQRWRDALGLALCAVLQIGESFYPLLAAMLIAIPFVVWALRSYGVAALPPAQTALVVVAIVAAGSFVMSPYLGLREQGVLASRGIQMFRPLSWLLPGRSGFPGWLMTGLAIAALLPVGRRAVTGLRHDPRLALAAGLVLIGILSLHVGGEASESVVIVRPAAGTSWHPYLWLARLLPGFEVVRGPGSIFVGAHMLMALLAGLGAAGLLRAAPPRWHLHLALGLVCLAWLDVARPEFLGLEPRVRYQRYALRPDEELLDFFAEVGARAQPGPILELPYGLRNLPYMSRGLLLAAYHRRPTSHCYNPPPASREFEALSRRLPDPEALAAVAALGFRVIVVHDDVGDVLAASRASGFEAAETRPGLPGLRRIHADRARTAWDIVTTGEGSAP